MLFSVCESLQLYGSASESFTSINIFTSLSSYVISVVIIAIMISMANLLYVSMMTSQTCDMGNLLHGCVKFLGSECSKAQVLRFPGHQISRVSD